MCVSDCPGMIFPGVFSVPVKVVISVTFSALYSGSLSATIVGILADCLHRLVLL